MAQVTVHPAEINVVTHKRVTLELSDLEAATLQAILTKVGGDPTDSYRGEAENIHIALSNAGYDFHSGLTQVVYKTTVRNGSIEFREKSYDNGFFKDNPYVW
jgi:hypothetical protein